MILRDDVVDAVRRTFDPSDVDDVLGWLSRVDSDRGVVDILVGATVGNPDTNLIRAGVETYFRDPRDVWMNEYDARIDYKAALKRLGLDRPYPV
jgi:hypothetical protein